MYEYKKLPEFKTAWCIARSVFRLTKGHEVEPDKSLRYTAGMLAFDIAQTVLCGPAEVGAERTSALKRVAEAERLIGRTAELGHLKQDSADLLMQLLQSVKARLAGAAANA